MLGRCEFQATWRGKPNLVVDVRAALAFLSKQSERAAFSASSQSLSLSPYAYSDMTTALEIRRPLKSLRVLLSRRRGAAGAVPPGQPLSQRLSEVFLATWDLGLTAFGGPPVHFQILYSRFVEGKGGPKWIDEQTVTTSLIACFTSACSPAAMIVPRVVRCMSGPARSGEH